MILLCGCVPVSCVCFSHFEVRGSVIILAQGSFFFACMPFMLPFTPGGDFGNIMDTFDKEDGLGASHKAVHEAEDGSEEEECELPVEISTPVKKQRISLSDCFETTDMPPAEAKPHINAYEELCGHISLAQILGMPETPESSRSEEQSSSPVSDFLLLDEVKHWHPNRLWAIVWKNLLEVSFPKKNMRLRTKQTDWRRYLNGYVTAPKKKVSFHADARKRSRASDIFKGLLARVTGAAWRDLKIVGPTMWARASEDDKYRWHALACAMKDPDIARRTGSERRKCKGPKSSEDFQPSTTTAASPVKIHEGCTGIMLTYNIGLGIKSPDVLAMVQDKATPADFILFFANSIFHKDCFETFWKFLVELGEKCRFKTIGASMELSENAEEPGRVHLHAYIGTGIKGGAGSMNSVVRCDISQDDLCFMGVKPYPRPTKPKKNHPKTVCDAVVNGLYYVIAHKTTTIMRKATFWHIEDCRH